MKFKQHLLNQDRGVSPVIGVILMVAITVILAAVIATFVMNMGPETNSPPNAQWEWSYNGTNVELEHGGGNDADPANFELVYESNSEDLTDYRTDAMTAGDSVALDNSYYNAGEEIKLRWEDPEGGSAQVVDKYTIPN